MVNNCSLVFPLDQAGVSRSVRQNCFQAESLACWLNAGSPSSIPSPARSCLSAPSVVCESPAGLQVAWGSISVVLPHPGGVCREVWAEVFGEGSGVAEAFHTLHQRRWKASSSHRCSLRSSRALRGGWGCLTCRKGMLLHLGGDQGQFCGAH